MAKFQMFCGNCGAVAKPRNQPSGSGPLEAVLWIGSTLLFLFAMCLAMIAIDKTGTMRDADAVIVGKFAACAIGGFLVSVIYSISRRASGNLACGYCNNSNVMPLDTPVAQQKLREVEAEKSRAKYGEEYAAYRQQIRAEIGRAPAQ